MRCILLFLCLTLPLVAQTPADPSKPLEQPTVRLWPQTVLKREVARPEAQAPLTPLKLTPKFQYKFDSDIDLIVRTAPEGRVKQTKEQGPLREKGFWANDPNAKEKTTIFFKGKYVYELLPLTNGELTVFVIPVEVKNDKGEIRKLTEADILTRSLQVETGVVPPGPDPDPDPDPDPVPPPVVTSFRVIFGLETGVTPTPAQKAVMYGKAVEDYLLANTTPEGGISGYRRYDKDTDTSNDQPTMNALWSAIKPKITTVPFMAVEVNGNAKILPFPASPAECLETLKKYRGGK